MTDLDIIEAQLRRGMCSPARIGECRTCTDTAIALLALGRVRLDLGAEQAGLNAAMQRADENAARLSQLRRDVFAIQRPLVCGHVRCGCTKHSLLAALERPLDMERT